MTLPCPSEWPSQACSQYAPIRELGEGASGFVMLAKKRKSKQTNEFVAVKTIVGTPDDNAYAHREADLLRELSHPNIIKVVDSWQADPAAVIALTYSQGPTVAELLKHGGSLSTLFCRVTIAQVTDALSYLHSRAVIHRDIKPCNIIISGALCNDDSIWDNGPDGDRDQHHGPDYWKDMRTKWKATLIDFGFARALTPQDVSNPGTKVNSKTIRNQISNCSADSRSNPKVFRKQMSAVGTKQFAAPEILTEMHEENPDHDPVTVTDTIGHIVSEYGLEVDAFSLGHSLRFMMTGCLPDCKCKDAIAADNSAVRRLLKSFFRIQNHGRKIKHRPEEALPGEAQQLIRQLTAREESKRISVRKARKHPWIADILPEFQHDGKIEYLELVLNEAKQAKGTARLLNR